MPDLCARAFRIRPAPRVTWVVEDSGLVLFDGDERRSALDTPEAALWDLLCRGVPWARLLRILAAAERISESGAELLASAAIAAWSREGWLVDDREAERA